MIHQSNERIEKECILLWSTQSGRSKACARRCARMIRLVSSHSKHLLSIIGKQDINNRREIHPNEKQLRNDITMDKMKQREIFFMSSGSSFDDFGVDNFMSLGKLSSSKKKYVLILFVSTTGDAEHCDTIQECWKALLQRSLPSNFFSSIEFCIFALGDRAYGPTAFCAAGRKLAARLVQLSAKPFCPIGYGDDGTPNGGVFADLDVWIHDCMLPNLFDMTKNEINKSLEIQKNSENRRDENDIRMKDDAPYCVDLLDCPNERKSNAINELSSVNIYESHFFQSLAPRNAYEYNPNTGMRIIDKKIAEIDSLPTSKTFLPVRGKILSNERITATDWSQDVRHITMEVYPNLKQNHSQTLLQQDTPTTSIHTNDIPTNQLPYHAGDVAIIIPQNSPNSVTQFLNVLPISIKKIADIPLCIRPRNANDKNLLTPWPSSNVDNETIDNQNNYTRHITLRTILTCCAAINSLPEREDLRVLSYFCNLSHPSGSIQASKLREMSEPSSDLYVDYILREKRTFGDLLYDFDSIGYGEGDGVLSSILTIEYLLAILPPLVPRAFSIASSPREFQYKNTKNNQKMQGTTSTFHIELCVAVVEGETRLGRHYKGVCSNYLANLTKESNDIRLWIRPGSFTKLPLDLKKGNISYPSFQRPVLCVGAGTGVAPLRSILREREIHRCIVSHSISENNTSIDHILCFGCRKETKDFYYAHEWKQFQSPNNVSNIRVITAFSQDQKYKRYVQSEIRKAEDDEALISKHILINGGAVYIAGGAKMARAVKDEIIELLGKKLSGGEKDAKILLKRLGRQGLFAVEAWS